MTPGSFLARLVSLPELQLVYTDARSRPGWLVLSFESVSEFRACSRCAELSQSVYDHRWVRCLDVPLRERKVALKIRKKRYWCSRCRKPFTELLYGIFKGARLTERLRRNILWCCSRFQSLVGISSALGCSSSTVRRSFYSHLERHFKRHLSYDFPKAIGIDEHFFGMSCPARFQPVCEQKYHTTLVDLRAHRLYRALKARDSRSLFALLKNEPGAAHVQDVVMDMSEGYRSLVRALFPNAKITVDKFHVLRLLVRALNKERKRVAGDVRKNRIGSLLLKSEVKLDFERRLKIRNFLRAHPRLSAIYSFKERLHALYRCRGRKWSTKCLERILRDLKSFEHIDALKTLQTTLTRWREEILNYFETRLTNAMTEGFNNKIKLIKRMAYGFRNEDAYDLRILYACYH